MSLGHWNAESVWYGVSKLTVAVITTTVSTEEVREPQSARRTWNSRINGCWSNILLTTADSQLFMSCRFMTCRTETSMMKTRQLQLLVHTTTSVSVACCRRDDCQSKSLRNACGPQLSLSSFPQCALEHAAHATTLQQTATTSYVSLILHNGLHEQEVANTQENKKSVCRVYTGWFISVRLCAWESDIATRSVVRWLL